MAAAATTNLPLSQPIKAQRVARLQPLTSAFTVVGISTALGKVIVLRGLVLVLDEERFSGKELKRCIKEYPGRSIRKAGSRILQGLVADLGTKTIMRLIEHLLQGRISDALLVKMTKDLSKSAVRKYNRTGSRWLAARAMFGTAYVGTLIENAAVFVVELSISSYLLIYRRARRSDPKFKEEQEPMPALIKSPEPDQDFPGIVQDTFIRSIASVCSEAAFASVGTLILPGTGTYVGQLVGSLVCWLI